MTWDVVPHCKQPHCPWWWAVWTHIQPDGQPFINTDGLPATRKCGPYDDDEHAFHDDVQARKYVADHPHGPGAQ